MNVKLFLLESIVPPDNCPDKTFECNLGGLEKTIRVIQTNNVYGIVIDGIYLSLASGKATFIRGDYALVRRDNKIMLGVNENLY